MELMNKEFTYAWKIMLRNPQLFQNGYLIQEFPLDQRIREFASFEKWEDLDREIKNLTGPNGDLYYFLKRFQDFNEIEFIISLRDSENEWEEDGIWHDDGSRVFAFSLSLTLSPEKITGGALGIRKKGDEKFQEIKTPGFGNIILFLTGKYGFEHKIHRVVKGQRLIIAGWCT